MKEILLDKGLVTQVDDSDYENLNQWKWYASKKSNGYYVRRNTGPARKQDYIYMSRVIMNPAEGLTVDHIDHNGLNNQRSNLRVCTYRENSLNRIPIGSSKYLGVCVYKSGGKERIRASIKSFGKTTHLGYYKTESDAARAYDKAASQIHGEFANLNFK
jgi:hypothetical protein